MKKFLKCQEIIFISTFISAFSFGFSALIIIGITRTPPNYKELAILFSLN
tara:strand:+ start:26 stop:175 length:150 start_codon:yes stop_codon:yes gene_type:complete